MKGVSAPSGFRVWDFVGLEASEYEAADVCVAAF